MERRKQPEPGSPEARARPAELPADYLRMVTEVFSTNFAGALKEAGKIMKGPYFSAEGAIFTDEIVFSVSLLFEEEIHATTVRASADFDPKASSPTAEEILGDCVDGAGAVLSAILDPKRPAQIRRVVSEPLASLENVPFQWTEMEINRRPVHVKIDKENPKLERMTEDWLEANDPEVQARREAEEREAESKFVTGEKERKNGKDGD